MGERVAGGRVRGWFTVPMRAQKRKDALHEPPLSGPSATLSPPCGERAGRGVPIKFMVPMHTRKRKGASHEPEEHPTSNTQRRTSNGIAKSLRTSAFDVRCSMLDVRCWTFDVFPPLRGFNARSKFGGFSP